MPVELEAAPDCETKAPGVYQIDPLVDARWSDLLCRHPWASVFHTPQWLAALNKTYGYQPVALTTAAPGEELSNGLVFCQISSWLTGRRCVSLPFSDHCDPLASTPEESEALLSGVAGYVRREHFRSVEIRPLRAVLYPDAGFRKSQEYCFHELDLRPEGQELFARFHKDSIQRKVRRAEREGISFEEGRSESELEKFYDLLLRTRRRHGVPPPPREWFRNLMAGFGNRLTIRVALQKLVPIAAILTLKFKDTLTYKYGGSDARFHACGGMQALLWRAIEEAKREGLCKLDLGRSDVENQGLVTFKNRWGARQSRLAYFRYPRQTAHVGTGNWSVRALGQIVAGAPSCVLRATGRLLYKHIG